MPTGENVIPANPVLLAYSVLKNNTTCDGVPTEADMIVVEHRVVAWRLEFSFAEPMAVPVLFPALDNSTVAAGIQTPSGRLQSFGRGRTMTWDNVSDLRRYAATLG